MATVAPPPYAEALKALGSNPSIQDVHNTVEKLASLPTSPPAYSTLQANMTPEQGVKLVKTVPEILVSPEGNKYIKETVKLATESIKKTDESFGRLNAKLTEIDGMNKGTRKFTPELVSIQKEWQTTVIESKNLAITISEYALRFAEKIIPTLENKSYTLEQKEKRVQSYIDQAEEYRTKAEGITMRYNGVLTNFTSLNAAFSSWARDESQALADKIAKAERELGELQKDLAAKRREILGVGIGTAASAITTGVIACLAGPFAPAVLIFGSIATLGLAGALIILSVEATQIENDITSKKNEIAGYKTQQKTIDDAKKTLVDLGNTELRVIQGSIAALNSFWDYARSDAQKIAEKLRNLKRDLDFPEDLGRDAQTIINLYKSMSLYLDEYSRGIVS